MWKVRLMCDSDPNRHSGKTESVLKFSDRVPQVVAENAYTPSKASIHWEFLELEGCLVVFFGLPYMSLIVFVVPLKTGTYSLNVPRYFIRSEHRPHGDDYYYVDVKELPPAPSEEDADKVVVWWEGKAREPEAGDVGAVVEKLQPLMNHEIAWCKEMALLLFYYSPNPF